MKIISAHQPYFAPYAGFFEKAMQSDVLVIMDAVQFPRGTTWLTRNRFKNDQGTLWLTIPVWKRGLGLQRINEVKICYEGRWQRKHMASLSSAYANAPFFEDHRSFLEKIFSEQMSSLLELNMRIIRYVLAQLAIETHIVTLSELGIEAKEPELSIKVAAALGATHFLAQSTARKYLDQEGFQNKGIHLTFFRPKVPVYPQLWGTFLPNLSVLDLLFNCGPKAKAILEKSCSAIRQQ